MRFTRPSGTTRPTRLGRVIAATTATLGTLAASLAVATPAASAVVNGEPSAPAPWAVQITTFSGVPGTPCSGVVVAPRASDLIYPLALAVTHKLHVDDLADTFTVYPSMSGSIAEAARRLHVRL